MSHIAIKVTEDLKKYYNIEGKYSPSEFSDIEDDEVVITPKISVIVGQDYTYVSYEKDKTFILCPLRTSVYDLANDIVLAKRELGE